MIQLENEFVTVELVPDSKVIKITWRGFIPVDVYKEALEKSLEIARENNISCWLTDARQIKVIKLESQRWALNDWGPRAISEGCYRKQALVMPEDLFGKASTDRIISQFDNNKEVVFSNFSSEEAALEWLTNSN